jgi:hypothetical protein
MIGLALASTSVLLRGATAEDISAIVLMAHSMKRQLVEWSPLYFRPRDGAEELHAAYLEFLIRSEDKETRVIVDDCTVVGFFHVVTQPRHNWIDDLYLSDPSRWPQVVTLLVDEVATPWVTCVSHYDDLRSAALTSRGLEPVSSFWARALDAEQDPEPPVTGPQFDLGNEVPRHVFGSGTPLDPSSPGALIVGDGLGGYVVGSPGIEPPLYDPGGPSCVVDRIHGTNRGALLDVAMSTAAARGDAGMVVVCGQQDHELRQVLVDAGFRAEVDLFALL